jgi:hypothetical protein
MLTADTARDLTKELLKSARPEWARLRRLVRYIRGRQALPWLPDNVESEYRDIARKSASNWLELVVRATAQGLHVDGYGDATSETTAGSLVWDRGWQTNGMDAHQHSLHRAVLSLGYSYLPVLPADDGGVWMRPESAHRMFAVYDDPADEWPRAAVREVGKDRWDLFDDEARYLITPDGVTVSPHNLGICPIVKMQAQLDLLGDPQGEIEQVVPVQDRIVDATFTLQMVAKYGAFPQRWIAGLHAANDDDGNPIPPNIKAYVDHILIAKDPDTKFGQFAAADLRQYVEALEAHIRHLAAITQTPPHYLLGSLVNLSAESLAAAESGLQRKIRDRREVLGEGYEQAMRLAALILGDEVAAADTSSQVHWADIESRSLAQVADALLKLGQLGIPAEMLVRMIPGWTQQDKEEAAAMIAQGDALDAMMRELTSGQVSPEVV